MACIENAGEGVSEHVNIDTRRVGEGPRRKDGQRARSNP